MPLINRAGTATMSEVITRYSPDDETAKELREKIHELDATGYVELADQWHHPVQVIHLSLTSLNSSCAMCPTAASASTA